METIFRKGIYEILKVFYENSNSTIHLREISRRTGLNINSVSRFLNSLVVSKVLISEKKGNSRNFFISQKFKKTIFPIFDFERFEKISFVRRKSVQDYISLIETKPFCLILFGSTAKGNSTSDSDMDIVEITNSKEKTNRILKKIESERGVRLHVIRTSFKDFKKMNNDDLVIKSAMETGFPIFGKDFFYEVIDE